MNVYSKDGNYLTQGLPDTSVCDAARQAAQRIADQQGETVYLGDDETCEEDLSGCEQFDPIVRRYIVCGAGRARTEKIKGAEPAFISSEYSSAKNNTIERYWRKASMAAESQSLTDADAWVVFVDLLEIEEEDLNYDGAVWMFSVAQ